jgi:hypothetical protein
VIRTLAAGLAFTLVASGIAQAAWGPPALLPAAIFGVVATVIQLLARWCYARWAPGPKTVFPKGWLYGMALRLGGVLLFTAAVLARREFFAPLPTAIGFLGVIVPLLFLELRTTR